MTFAAEATQELEETIESLSLVLEKEFSALNTKNLISLEEAQHEKVVLLNRIANIWDALDPRNAGNEDNDKFAKIRETLSACRNHHERNEILLQRQIDEIKTLLNTLTSNKKNSSSSIYNRLGKLIN